MNRRLNAEDRHAVDLLLSRPDASDKPLVEMVFARPVKGKFEARLDAAEKLLGLLDHLPAAEPPANLVAKTMERIASARMTHTGMTHTGAPVPKRTSSKSAQRPA